MPHTFQCQWDVDSVGKNLKAWNRSMHTSGGEKIPDWWITQISSPNPSGQAGKFGTGRWDASDPRT